MEKKILVAVDGSPAALKAVDYVGLMEGALIRDLRVTLLFIMSPIPPYLRREGQRNPESFKRLRELESRNRKQAAQVLDKCAERLVRHGLDPEAVEKKPLPRSSDAARDILFEAEQGLYDALVMGRRGISKTQELFVGSVTNKIVQHAERLPLWVVGGQVTSHKVLCPVDGSEGSLKAVDHLAFMLGENPECKVTLLHVGASLGNYCTLDFVETELAEDIEEDIMHSDAQCMDDFYARALKVLDQAGLSPDQVETKTIEGGLSVPGAILDEVKKGDYGTVVLGRRGESRSFFLGHVSDKVMSKAKDVAVWMVG
ncbi:universal stress protein [Desulfoferula mesophila]|uniref:Universal stress protein n=1 Tax=Desulfoferula mesophila TaxID=3058419 RepID=A0AAU9EBE5_9BACT|nr:universal stress protein [Desulfoferula mesophilus]